MKTLKKNLAEFPDSGDLIKGTGGVRKIRLKSAYGGKSGGFRICYFDDPTYNQLLLINIYAKNELENLTSEDKNNLKDLTNRLKGKNNE